jgi:hypothetical protein
VNDNLIVNDNFNTGGVFNAISTGLGSVGVLGTYTDFLSISSRSRCIFYINRCAVNGVGLIKHSTRRKYIKG